MHTHFGSATHFATVILEVLLGATLWRLGWLTLMHKVSNPHVQGLARAALTQL